MILVTSANGKTGRHVIAALVAKGLPVRALVHPGELAIGQATIERAKEAGVEQFVCFSVIHPLKKAVLLARCRSSRN
jgi:nucleoside-diphosphate-sugar epimerase